MALEKDQSYYYFIYYPASKTHLHEFGLAKVVALRHVENMFPTLRIEKIYNITFNKGYVGFERRIKVGNEISANELQGVGASGTSEYLFKTNKDLFDKIFKINR